MPTLVNPRPQPARLHLSDGSERIVHAWGLVILPEWAKDGEPLGVLRAELLSDQQARQAQPSAPRRLRRRQTHRRTVALRSAPTLTALQQSATGGPDPCLFTPQSQQDVEYYPSFGGGHSGHGSAAYSRSRRSA